MLTLNAHINASFKSLNISLKAACFAFRNQKHLNQASKQLRITIASLLILAPFHLFAVDIVTVNVGESPNDKRIIFKNELIKQALELTKSEYGDYKIVENPHRMNISRAFRELEKGENLSLTFAHTRPEFEKMALPVRVSLRSGVDSYRLLVVRKGQEARFENVKTLEDLKQFTVGLRPTWATYRIMKSEGFTIVDAPNYDGMFRMLDLGRFDFIPRAVNEVFVEQDLYKPLGKGLVVLPKIALYIPSYTYMFVSPKQPRIYQRFNSALHAMSINGDLAKLADKHYKKYIDEAEIQNRRVITINHTQLTESPALNAAIEQNK